MIYSALIGCPVDHSISPILFNYLAKCSDLEYGHLKINILNKNKLKNALESLGILGFSGINVTLPYKLDIIKHLDRVSTEAKKIGAVNTVVIKNGHTIGYNTDANGALLAIESKLKTIEPDDRVLVIGSGGAARAVIFALYKKTKKIVILSRNLKEAESVSHDFSKGIILSLKITDQNIQKYLNLSNIIVNATPVGMYPLINDEIINRTIWQNVDVKNKYFFDAIFNPYKTTFLKEAEARGAKVCSGTYMMIFQAIKAFNLWTGIKLPELKIEKINNILKKSLTD